jgi:hypothetical protein
MRDLQDFFGFIWNQNCPKVFLVENRKTIDELRGVKTREWSVGWINKRDVYILDKKNYERDSCHKYSDKGYEMLMKHELAHCFFSVVSGGKLEPDWLWEGVAIFVSGQLKNRVRPKELKCFLDIYSGKKKDLRVYDESGFAVEILIKKFGKRKLLKLIKELKGVDSKKDFKEVFKKVYSKDITYDLFD